jgi:putative membrane protein
MGAAEMVPGVSAGTIAFITGIYEQLVLSFNAVDQDSAKLLLQFQFKAFWRRINGNFILVVLGGMVTSFLTIAGLMSLAFRQHPVIVWSFFFGVILISGPLVLRGIRLWTTSTYICFAAGCALSYAFTLFAPIQTPAGLWFAFFVGAIAICAMMLPGISGAFVLLLLGKYSIIIQAFTLPKLSVIAVFMAGCIIGLLGFSRFLTWILKNYHSATVALLAGLMLGSLNKVWPWREVLEYVTSNQGTQVPVFDRSVWPWNYLTVTGKDPQVFQAIFMMALGVFIVVLIEKFAERLKTKI